MSARAAFLSPGASPVFESRKARGPATSIYLSYNPNDLESPEEKQARMEMVRKIQATFYNATATTSTTEGLILDDDEEEQSWSSVDRVHPSILHNVPLWRVQWTELPGYQNVLNVHVPHYTHMFRQLLAQQKRKGGGDAYFGHVYLPGGSDNLGKPEYNLPEEEEDSPSPSTATLIGTLMKITDVLEDPDDGRLTMVVQGVAPIRILSASQQVPYAIASRIEILPDQEWIDLYQRKMKEEGVNMVDQTVAKDILATQSDMLRPLEYHSTQLDRSASSTLSVSPLSNVNGSVAIDLKAIAAASHEIVTSSSMLAEDAKLAGEESMHLAILNRSDSNLLRKEKHVWIQLDLMLRLLGELQPGLQIPVPSQLLGLLPTNAAWPDSFRLKEFAIKLAEQGQASVGTYSQSPFVQLSHQYPNYPPLRRASRLSYSIWLLLESIAIGEQATLDRQRLLELPRIGDRLELAIQHLKTVNYALEIMLKG